MYKGVRFILSLVLVVVMVCGIVGCFAEGAPVLEAGSIVTFGRYPQTAEGTDETTIEWIVLEVDEENHRALLISKYGLDAKQYNTEKTDVTWETCTLRAWLNQDFLSKAFSQEEQAAILLTDVDNSGGQGYSAWSTNGGNNTQDYIFLLSYTEANRYFGVEYYEVLGSDQNITGRIAPTTYAIQQGVYAESGNQTSEGKDSATWWLRSPGLSQNYAASVWGDGALLVNNVDCTTSCIRPVMWVDMELAGDSLEVVTIETVDSARDRKPSLTVGSIVNFGKYPQAETDDEAPIEWIVLDIDESNHTAMLISKYGIDAKPYNTEDKDVTWETCSLRTWLNNDFLNRAFTVEEQSAIQLTKVQNDSSQGYSGWSFTGGKISSGNNTQDHIFLLSYLEANRYFGVKGFEAAGDPQNSNAQILPTAYAVQQGASTSTKYQMADGSDAGRWWLRSPGDYQDAAVIVYYDGKLDSTLVDSNSCCVRPVLWVDMNQVTSEP